MSEGIPHECPECSVALKTGDRDPWTIELMFLPVQYTTEGVNHVRKSAGSPEFPTAYHTNIDGLPLSIVMVYPCCGHREEVDRRNFSITWDDSRQRDCESCGKRTYGRRLCVTCNER